ncbi:MAG: prephenate dehydratase [SAR202 cluster bacterium]|nr:prephenate dehydratase [SAR202 cluster bacterium]
MNKLAFLGPIGSFSQEAAISYNKNLELLSCNSIPQVIEKVKNGLANEAILPIENSIEGSVTSTIDLLIQETKLKIKTEIVIPIEHCLLIKDETKLENIQHVYSHPQALSQCRKFLTDNIPNAELIASLSTSNAVEEMKKSKYISAAIANQKCASIYNVKVISKKISDNKNNYTRFIILSDRDNKNTGKDKTSICFDFSNDSPGILYMVLEKFAKQNINLTKIESRPSKTNLGNYIFLIDLEGHRSDEIVNKCFNQVKPLVSMFKILGSYPKFNI